jgi:hypothetical protein
VGIEEQRSEAISWFSALGGVAADLPVHANLFVRLGAFAAAPFTRPKAFVESAGDVHRPERVNARVHAALGAVLP